MNAEAQKLFDAIKARGYSTIDGTGDLRDAAHEAHHALFCGLKPPWTRDRVHDALVKRANRLRRLRNGELVAYELDARAVEWSVCERFSLAYDVEHWADIMWWETAKNMRIQLPDPSWLIEQIGNRRKLKRHTEYVNAVIALVEIPYPKRKKAA